MNAAPMEEAKPLARPKTQTRTSITPSTKDQQSSSHFSPLYSPPPPFNAKSPTALTSTPQRKPPRSPKGSLHLTKSQSESQAQIESQAQRTSNRCRPNSPSHSDINLFPVSRKFTLHQPQYQRQSQSPTKHQARQHAHHTQPQPQPAIRSTLEPRTCTQACPVPQARARHLHRPRLSDSRVAADVQRRVMGLEGLGFDGDGDGDGELLEGEVRGERGEEVEGMEK